MPWRLETGERAGLRLLVVRAIHDVVQIHVAGAAPDFSDPVGFIGKFQGGQDGNGALLRGWKRGLGRERRILSGEVLNGSRLNLRGRYSADATVCAELGSIRSLR